MTALLQSMDMISRQADANEVTATISVDQSAAFDCVCIQFSLRNYLTMGSTIMH